MAETLGSLVDKLSIKNLRIWHLDEALENEGISASKRDELKAKRDLADKQRQDLMNEVDGFLVRLSGGKFVFVMKKSRCIPIPMFRPLMRSRIWERL